jgi:nicotinate-nucleotide adenylyltransferase
MIQSPRKKVAVFGGTFDPVHLGHLIMAEQAREQTHLDQVWLIPAASPPHKQGWPVTPFAQRVEMLHLALAGQPDFRVDELEKDRSGPSYTADTLAELQSRHGDVDFQLLLGSDCLPDLPLWRDPASIVRRAGLLIVERPGWPVMNADALQAALCLPAGLEMRLQTIESPLIDIASRDLRKRAAAGRSLRFLVPRAVECYIREKGLYHT